MDHKACNHDSIRWDGRLAYCNCADCKIILRRDRLKGTYLTTDKVIWKREKDDGKIRGVDAGRVMFNDCI